MTNEAIEAAARAVAMELDGTDECWQDFSRSLRIAAPALMEEGARLALEAAADCVDELAKVMLAKNPWFARDVIESHAKTVTSVAAMLRDLATTDIIKRASHDPASVPSR